MHFDVAIIIPARLGSQRLANKPLKMIGDLTMIEHVVKQVQKTGVANLYVATDSEEIASKAQRVGGKYIMTDSDCLSGTQRVYQAFKKLPNHDSINYILNVQGDMPFVDSQAISEVIENLKNSGRDIVTPVTKVDLETISGDSNVKVIIDNNNKALYFSRSLIPHGATEFLYHVGIYGFTALALEKFANLPASYLENTEKLEQLKALENGMDIGVCYVDNVPISVDTAEDLEKAIKFYNAR